MTEADMNPPDGAEPDPNDTDEEAEEKRKLNKY